MYRKGVANQNVGFVMVSATTGAAVTGATVTVRRVVDGGAQAAATGTVTEKGNGQYNYAASAADLAGDHVSLLFAAPGCIPVEKTVVTTAADPTDGTRFGLAALPDAEPGDGGGLLTYGTGPGQLNPEDGGLGWDTVTILSGIGAGVTDTSGATLTSLNARQAMAVLLTAMTADRSGVGTSAVTAKYQGASPRVTATRTSQSQITATVVAPQ